MNGREYCDVCGQEIKKHVPLRVAGRVECSSCVKRSVFYQIYGGEEKEINEEDNIEDTNNIS